MLAKSKRFVVGAALAAVTVAAVPATAAGLPKDTASAASPCDSLFSVDLQEWYQTVFVHGAYTAAGAIDVQLTCGVVRYGETVGRVTEDLPGPVAVVQGSVTVHAGPVSICHEIRVRYLDRVSYIDNCP